jgi:glucose/arabinose dehydrogenase
MPLGAALALCPGAAWGQPRLTSVGTFQSPVYVTAPPGDSHRLMVVERTGRVRLVKDGRVAPTPFLDISSSVDPAGAGGLLSIAFPPNYATSGRVYAYYTDGTGIRVAEFQASTRDRAEASTRRILLTQAHSANKDHYAGQLQFDTDGLLYIAIGDGGDGGANAQNLDSWWGKILRINPLASGTAAYTIPPDNPVLAGRRSEVWSHGLRNPWRFSLDRQTGDVVIGDVGQSRVDEVDTTGRSGGANFGWNCFEGRQLYSAAPDSCAINPPPNPVPPVLEKALPETAIGGWCRYSLTGGYVVRNAKSSLNGRYVYGDYCSGEVRSAQLTTTGATGDSATGVDLPDLTLVSFGEDASGRIYAVSLAGPVYRIDK